MAKKSDKAYLYDHLLRADQASGRVTRIYQKYVEEFTKLAAGLNIDPDKVFSFADYPQTAEALNKTLAKVARDVEICIDKATREEWEESNLKNDDLIEGLFKSTGIPKERLREFYNRNTSALEAFQQRKINGLGLSENIWKITEQYKGEIELGIDVALGEGRSAQQLSQDIRQLLKQPDNLFRRVKDKRGNLVLSQRAAAFHPGQGVYRSSYKNAMRVARSEVNMAYREADDQRWNELPFVVGYEVRLSARHPFPDICNDLAGKYPKTFKFRGWHPHCFCYCVSILPTEEEMDALQHKILNGEDLATFKSQNEIKDVPNGMRNWIAENAERAKDWKSTPYFIRDNFVEGDLSKGLTLDNRPHGKTKIKTPEEKQAVRKEWYERKAVRHYGQSVLSYMNGISDINTDTLSALLKGGDIKAIEAEARALAAKGKELLGLKYVENPMSVARQFSAADAKAVNTAVDQKLKLWESQGLTSLADQKKKLSFEIDWLAKNQKYSTWEVAQSAYKKQLSIVEVAIEKESIVSSVGVALNFSTQNKAFKTLLSEWDILVNDNASNAALKAKAAQINAKYSSILKAQAKKNTIKPDFSKDAYSKDRKDKAVWAKTKPKADAELRDSCGELWRTASDAEKQAAYNYTSGSCYINEPLRKQYYSGGKSGGAADTKALTDLIERSAYDKDLWIQRGVSYDGAKGLIGVDFYSIKDGSSLVGVQCTERAFSSCGAAKGKGFSSNNVIYNIYCPKGTKMLYCEPFSAYGRGGGRVWDGIATQTNFGDELEVLLQRGTTFRITKAEYTGGRWFIDLEVIAQNPVK